MNNQTPMLAVNLYAAPDFTGRVILYLENGRVKSDLRLPEDYLVCSLGEFIALAKRCGDEFQKITVPAKFTGQILVTALNGEVIREQELSPNHIVTTLGDIAEVAQQVGIITKKPDTKQ
jgi:hypothetical protein